MMQILLRAIHALLLILTGLASVWLAIDAQNYWAPLPLHEKQWEPGWQGYIHALSLFAVFIFLASYIPAIYRFIFRQADFARPSPPPRVNWLTGLVGLALALSVAQAFRFYGLEDNPPGLWLDEGINVMDAEQIQKTGQHSIYLYSMSTQRTALFVEILTQTLKLPWSSRVEAVRGTAAILGFITVVLFLLLGWAMFSFRMGVLMAFLLAVSHWHVNYSRWGMEQILSPLFEIGAFFFFFLAFRLGSRAEKPRSPSTNLEETEPPAEATPRPAPSIFKRALNALPSWLCYILAGIFFGGGIYAYSNFRLFLVGAAIFFILLPFNWLSKLIRSPRWVILAVVLLILFSGGSLLALHKVSKGSYETLLSQNQLPQIEGRPEAYPQFLAREHGYLLTLLLTGLFAAYLLLWRAARADWFGFGLMVVTILIVLAPFLSASLKDWWAFTKRAAETSVVNNPVLLKQMASKTALGMHWQGDENGRHNLVHAPQLSRLPAALSALGLLYAAMTLANPISRLLLLWVFFGLMPGMITWEAPHASRMLDALPPLLILAALAWREVYRAIARIPKLGHAIGLLATLVGCLAIYKDDFHICFVERLNREDVYESFLPDEVYAAKFAGELPEDVALYVDPQLNSKHNFWFYTGARNTGGRRFIQRFDVGTMPVENIPNEKAAFVVMRSGEGLVAWLRELYPEGELTVGRSPWGRFNFAAMVVTRDQVLRAFQRWKDGDLKLRNGLLATYRLEGDVLAAREVPRLLDWNIPDATGGRPPDEVTWDGSLWQPKTGYIHFGTHPQNVTVEIDGTPWIRGRGPGSREDGQYMTRDLQYGLHRFHAVFDHKGGVGVPYYVWMMWRAPGSNLPGATPYPSEYFSPALK